MFVLDKRDIKIVSWFHMQVWAQTGKQNRIDVINKREKTYTTKNPMAGRSRISSSYRSFSSVVGEMRTARIAF